MVAFMGWYGKRKINQLDEHNKELPKKVSYIEYNNTIGSFRQDINKVYEKIDDCRQELSSKFDKLTILLIEDARKRDGK